VLRAAQTKLARLQPAEGIIPHKKAVSGARDLLAQDSAEANGDAERLPLGPKEENAAAYAIAERPGPGAAAPARGELPAAMSPDLEVLAARIPQLEESIAELQRVKVAASVVRRA
jgi:hypothetical protein